MRSSKKSVLRASRTVVQKSVRHNPPLAKETTGLSQKQASNVKAFTKRLAKKRDAVLRELARG